MRGERMAWRTQLVVATGSSPHARGTPTQWLCQHDLVRFIPACAGNALAGVIASSGRAVHPRMRGERIRNPPPTQRHVGSSPHARGTLEEQFVIWRPIRFIPACAGNASTRSPGLGQWSVHPRMRGERSVLQEAPPSGDGSSPHARGTLRSRPAPAYRPRFIPACAGNAAARTCPGGRDPVHPRMRGERTGKIVRRVSGRGSSPHARGTHGLGHSHTGHRRFIPACAGNA